MKRKVTALLAIIMCVCSFNLPGMAEADPFEIINTEIQEISLEQLNIALTVKNNTGASVSGLLLTVCLTNAEGDIINATMLGNDVRVKDGRTIRLNTNIKKMASYYAIYVDKIKYFDANGNSHECYLDNTEEFLFPQILSGQSGVITDVKTKSSDADEINDLSNQYFTEAEQFYNENKYDKAIELYMQAAELGNSKAWYKIARMYYFGDGVEIDFSKAMEYAQKSADLSNGAAFNLMGFMYEYGEGVEQDYDQAINCYQRGIELGCDYSVFNLGYMYYYGEGVEQDYTQALSYFKTGAEMGNSESWYYLGSMYFLGEGVEQDYTQALTCFIMAADLGKAESYYIIANYYYYGFGVEQDYAKALRFFQKGVELAPDFASDYKSIIEEVEKAVAEMSVQNTQSFVGLSIGDTICMGSYEQDNNLSNQQEPIEWKVISIDSENNRALVISTYGLDGVSYGKPMVIEEYERNGLNWETSYLRKWLNEEFYSEAFTEEEKNRIVVSSIQTKDKAGICNTQDKIFVLSGSEVKKYFKKAADAACKITEYSKNTLRVEQGAEMNGYGAWWLRDMVKIVHKETNGNFMQNTYNEAAYVIGDEGTKYFDQGKSIAVFIDYLISVRPAMWIWLDTYNTADNLQIEDCDPVKRIISSCPYITKNKKETKEYYSSSASYERDFPEGVSSHTWKITIQEGVVAFSDAAHTTVLTVRNNGKVYELIPVFKWEISLLEALPEMLAIS